MNMTAEELDKKYDLMEKAMDALMAGDRRKMLELNKDIIMDPDAAMSSFRMMGKERLLASGFNLSAADEAYGEGWLDREPLPRKFRETKNAKSGSVRRRRQLQQRRLQSS